MLRSIRWARCLPVIPRMIIRSSAFVLSALSLLPAQEVKKTPPQDSSAAQKEEAKTQDPKSSGVETRTSDIKIPSDHEGRAVLDLRLVDALRLGRLSNIDLKSDELVPYQRSEDLRIENAFFEPEFFADASVDRTKTAARNIYSPSIDRETYSGSMGLRQRVVTGGQVELKYAPMRTRQSTSASGFPDRIYTSDLDFSLTQPLLRGAWTDYTLRNVHTAEANFSAAQSRFQRTVQDTLLAIVEAYWELTFAREDYRVSYQALELAQEQLRITNERIRVRDLAERDRVSDEADVARRQEELIRAENQIRFREDELRRLLFDDHDGRLWNRNLRPISPIDTKFEDRGDDWRQVAREALRTRPDVSALRADVRVSEVAMQASERDLMPGLDLVGKYGSNGTSLGGDSFLGSWENASSLDNPSWSLALQFSMPIGNNAALGARDRAQLTLERSRRQLYSSELDVAKEVRDALRNLRTLAESVKASAESVRLADTVLDTERERLKVGRGTIFEVQQRNQELQEARRRLLRNKLDYRKAEATLEHVRGTLEIPHYASESGR